MCFNGCNYFSEPGIHGVTKTFFFCCFLACEGIWLLLYCYEAAKASGQIPAGTSGQGDGLFSFLLSVSVLVRIISYIYFFVFV